MLRENNSKKQETPGPIVGNSNKRRATSIILNAPPSKSTPPKRPSRRPFLRAFLVSPRGRSPVKPSALPVTLNKQALALR